MRNFTILLFLILPTLSFGQYEYSFLKEFYFGRQPSARAEAMGKSYVSIDGDLTSAYFNPAGIATIQGLEVSGSYASPYYMLKDANYGFMGVGYKFNDYLAVGLNRNQFSFGENLIFTDDQGNTLGPYDPAETNYSLTIASQPIKNLFLGLNTNYFQWSPPLYGTVKTLYFDFGAIKKFEFLQKEESGHTINLGASLNNFNYGKITLDYNGYKSSYDLPVIARLGANYQFILHKHFLLDTLKTFKFLILGEYQDVLNSAYESALRTGAEITFLEILSLRAGYYLETIDRRYFPSANFGEIRSFTYGLGLQIPLCKLTKTPLNINFDYTSLTQPLYSPVSPDMGNFSIYTLRLNWIFKDKK